MFAFHITASDNADSIVATGLKARGPSDPRSPYYGYASLRDQPVGVYFTVDDNWKSWRWETGMKDHEGARDQAISLIVFDVDPARMLADPMYTLPEFLAFYIAEDIAPEDIVAVVNLGSTNQPRPMEEIEEELKPFPGQPINDYYAHHC